MQPEQLRWIVKRHDKDFRVIVVRNVESDDDSSPVRVGCLHVRSPKDEEDIWSLEKTHWEYVKANDLERYRGLWHDNFLGWPFVNSAPVRKDHITDWITANTSKGIKLQSYSIGQLAIQLTGDIALDYYRINAT